MSEEVTTEPVSDKDQNMAALRQRAEAAEAQAAENAVFKNREILRLAGFNPDSGQGKSLMRDLASGSVEASIEDFSPLVEYADTEYDWTPETTLTPTEQQQVDGQERRESIEEVTTSDQPPDILEAIQEAEAAGDLDRARYLKNSVAIQKMMAG